MRDVKFKFQFYRRFQQNAARICAEAEKEGEKIGIPKELRGTFGLGGGSFTPATLPEDVIEAMDDVSRKVVSLDVLVDQIREIVKDVYGDGFDVAPTSTAEAALWLTFDVLASPPLEGRGDNYRSCYIAPYERHIHHQASYGRPFPPKYKDLFSDRGVTAGEYGLHGKRLNNLETILVPLQGARYENHGIKYSAVPILTTVDPDASRDNLARVADRYTSRLAAVTSLGYDTIGYGYGVKDKKGIPKLQKYIGKLAKEYDIPYICDNARGLPFVGTDPRKISADLIIYSMDKAAGAPTSGLIIGREDLMVSVRKALGMHGARRGTVSSYGKAAYVTFDPGKEALAGQIIALKKLRDEPAKIVDAVDDLYKIVKEEIEALDARILEDLHISKSVNGASVEINYVDTWKNGHFGLPIFSIEDMYAGSNIPTVMLSKMGIRPPLWYDGNILMSTRQGTTDAEGQLIERKARYAVKAVLKTLEILFKWCQ